MFIGIIIVTIMILLLNKFFPFKNIDYGKSYGQKCESWIEKKLYYALKGKGYLVHTQTKCGPYRIDTTLPEYKVAIECGGKDFHSTPEQKRYDANRSRYLRKHGWRSVLRFSGSRINKDLNQCVKRIERKIYKS